MKQTTKFFAGSALLCAALFASCSKSVEVADDDLAIRLNAGMNNAVIGRAVINEGSTFIAGIAGWETEQTNNNYATAVKWKTTASITASASAAGITMTTGQFYNSTTTIKTFMKAWYPAGVLGDSDGQVTFAGGTTPGYETDGTTDVMLATEVWGSAVNKSIKNLAFTHQLTQFKFKVVADKTFTDVGAKLKSLTIQNAQLPTGIDLVNNNVKYAGAALLIVPKINAQLLTDVETVAGLPVMVAPFAGKTFKVNVVTVDKDGVETEHNDVEITIDGHEDFVIGRAYTITIAFGSPGVNATASVTPWTTGTGSGSVN